MHSFKRLVELTAVREINAHLPFADPIMLADEAISYKQFRREFYPPELYVHDADLNIPVRRR